MTGIVLWNGAPVESAQVSWVGQAHEEAPATTDRFGRFTLERVPTTARELVARAPKQDAALRPSVLVVGGRTSDLGTLELQPAETLRVTVRDDVTEPNLGLRDALVHLQEISGLEATTDGDGMARLSCLPPSGCYTTEVSRFPFSFTPRESCPTDGKWNGDLLVLPDGDPPPTRARVHHALSRLAEIQAKLETCTSGCEIPSWWAEINGPPCPWPIRTWTQTDDADRIELERRVVTMGKMERFHSNAWSEITCPIREGVSPVCIEGSCALASSEQVVETNSVADGYVGGKNLPTDLFVTSSFAEARELADALGFELTEPVEPDQLFVFFKTILSDEPPRLSLVQMAAESCQLFFEGRIYPTEGQSKVAPGDYAWSLHLLEFLPGALPSPEQLTARIAWLRPL